MMAGMGQFSIKQMLVSFTLITVSLWMSIQFERARENILFWVGVGPTLGGAVYNLNGRPLRGMRGVKNGASRTASSSRRQIADWASASRKPGR